MPSCRGRLSPHQLRLKRAVQAKPAEPAVKPRPTKSPTIARAHKVPTRSQVIYLPDDQIDALDKLSRATDRSKSDLVREAIASFLSKAGGV